MNEWKSVKDNPPEPGTVVFIWPRCGDYAGHIESVGTMFVPKGRWSSFATGFIPHVIFPTHWMSIPEGPVVEDSNE